MKCPSLRSAAQAQHRTMPVMSHREPQLVKKELQCVIAASEATVRAAGAGVKTGRAEEITVKGKSEPIKVHVILALEE